MISTSLEKVYEFEPIPQGLGEAESKLILGGEACMWSERAPQVIFCLVLFSSQQYFPKYSLELLL